jgi:O-succinylbenzoate synthase
MRIEQIEVYHVAMPMKQSWRTAFGEMDRVDSVFVRMVVEGVEGWGESAPYAAPQYCSEFTAGAVLAIRDWLGPALLDREVADGAELQRLLSPFKGNHFAKGALDIAWWDAVAKSRDEPLWRLIGGTGPKVAVGADVAVQDDLETLLATLERVQDEGFERTKLKFRAGWGLEMVERVRSRFPDAVIHIDCNSGFTLAETKMFKTLDQFGLEMIEQPLAHDDIQDHATLQREISTPICLDETIVSLDKARHAIAAAACGWINLKVGRTGGLTNAVAIHDYCRDHDMPCWVGGMLESSVGQGPSIALATLDNIHYGSDIFPSARFYDRDLSLPEIELAGSGTVMAPDRPGHGFAPDPDLLARHAVSAFTVVSD